MFVLRYKIRRFVLGDYVHNSLENVRKENVIIKMLKELI